jgi:hypothetical protein
MKSSRYYEFLASQPCYKCGASPVEIAHIRLLKSRKTGLVLPRRNGIGVYSALPLCPECHRLGKECIHEVGERNFFHGLGSNREALLDYVAASLAGFIESA